MIMPLYDMVINDPRILDPRSGTGNVVVLGSQATNRYRALENYLNDRGFGKDVIGEVWEQIQSGIGQISEVPYGAKRVFDPQGPRVDRIVYMEEGRLIADKRSSEISPEGMRHLLSRYFAGLRYAHGDGANLELGQLMAEEERNPFPR